MKFTPKKAVRIARPCRAFFHGPSGSGKTFSSLLIAKGLAGEGKVVALDTEESSACLYADALGFEFDHFDVPRAAKVEDYLDLIRQCADAGYASVVLDSCSHFWEAVKDRADTEGKKGYGGNSFGGWAVASPLMKKIIHGWMSLPIHIVMTARAKQDYVIEENSKGKKQPKKIGLAPDFKDGIEYEFDLTGRFDMEHNLIIDKTRYSFLSGEVIPKPGTEFGQKIAQFLLSAPSIEATSKPTEEQVKKALAKQLHLVLTKAQAKYPHINPIAWCAVEMELDHLQGYGDLTVDELKELINRALAKAQNNYDGFDEVPSFVEQPLIAEKQPTALEQGV